MLLKLTNPTKTKKRFMKSTPTKPQIYTHLYFFEPAYFVKKCNNIGYRVKCYVGK